MYIKDIGKVHKHVHKILEIVHKNVQIKGLYMYIKRYIICIYKCMSLKGLKNGNKRKKA